MGRLIATLGGAIVVVAIVADAPSEPPPQTVQTTIAVGAAPALEGRWLLLTTMGTAGRRSTASLWDVTRENGNFVLTERFVKLSPEHERGGWQPTPEDLRQLGAGWESATPEPRNLAQIHHEIIGRDGLDDAMKQEPIAVDASWIVRQSMTFTPGASRPIKEVRVLAVNADERDGYRGRYVTATLAAVPMPIPIRLEGTFRLLRLPPASRSLWQRFLDVFRGCN